MDLLPMNKAIHSKCRRPSSIYVFSIILAGCVFVWRSAYMTTLLLSQSKEKQHVRDKAIILLPEGKLEHDVNVPILDINKQQFSIDEATTALILDSKKQQQLLINNDTTTIAEKHAEDVSNFLPRILALVFPQFHEDALNSYLWGEGFTDWDNLRKAPSKNRLGFSIPRPTELGYYNYTQIEPRKKQGELAKQYGIDGFLYHHYWFYDETHPGPNLHKPLLNMLNDGHPDVPFALHWCASKWTNTWSGQVRANFAFKEPSILQKQYFPTDDKDGKITEHYNWLRQFFHHPNYIKVDGKPLLMMYMKKPSSFPVLDVLKQLAIKDGFPGIYCTVGLTKPHEHLLDIGNYTKTIPFTQKYSNAFKRYKFDKTVSYPNPTEWNTKRSLEIPQWCVGNSTLHPRKNRVRDIAGIISSFDNTPRRNFEDAHLWSPDAPDVIVKRFRHSLHAAIYYEACCFPNDISERMLKSNDDDDRFILINAMNEWAEGMALEPSDVYGRQFLETIRDTKREIINNGCNL